MTGYAVTVLLDTGANVSMIDSTWKEKYLLCKDIGPLTELLGKELAVLAITGEEILYDGLVEIVLNLQGYDDPIFGWLRIYISRHAISPDLPKPIQ